MSCPIPGRQNEWTRATSTQDPGNLITDPCADFAQWHGVIILDANHDHTYGLESLTEGCFTGSTYRASFGLHSTLWFGERLMVHHYSYKRVALEWWTAIPRVPLLEELRGITEGVTGAKNRKGVLCDCQPGFASNGTDGLFACDPPSRPFVGGAERRTAKFERRSIGNSWLAR